jgi:hypothetical protein
MMPFLTNRDSPLSPWGRGREAMTCGRVRYVGQERALDGAAVSHSAELVRGDSLSLGTEGPLIRPSGTPDQVRGGLFSPRGEGTRRRPRVDPHRGEDACSTPQGAERAQ